MADQGNDPTGSGAAEPLRETLEEARAAAEETVQKLDEAGKHIGHGGKAKHKGSRTTDDSLEAIDRGGLDTGHPFGGPEAADLPDVEGIDVGGYDTGNPGGGPK